jgi:hypothetical protein
MILWGEKRRLAKLEAQERSDKKDADARKAKQIDIDFVDIFAKEFPLLSEFEHCGQKLTITHHWHQQQPLLRVDYTDFAGEIKSCQFGQGEMVNMLNKRKGGEL